MACAGPVPRKFDRRAVCRVSEMSVPRTYRGRPVRARDKLTVASARKLEDAWRDCWSKMRPVFLHNYRVAAAARCGMTCQVERFGWYAGLIVLIEVLIYVAIAF